MSPSDCKVLLIGYGNPGRVDDGLGPALAEAVAATGPPGVTVDADYQLTVEDAAAVARHDIVIFADADVGGPEPFAFRRIEPKTTLTFSSHEIAPEAVLGLAHDLFGARTRGFALAIRGYEFNEFCESLSARARANLDQAVGFIGRVLREGDFREVRAEPEAATPVNQTPSNGDQP